MKRKRFPEEQIALVLRQAESSTPVDEITRGLSVSEATLLPLEEEVRGAGGGRGSLTCPVPGELLIAKRWEPIESNFPDNST